MTVGNLTYRSMYSLKDIQAENERDKIMASYGYGTVKPKDELGRSICPAFNLKDIMEPVEDYIWP